MRSGVCPHWARPSFHFSASWAPNSSVETPALRASSSLTHGAKSSPRICGKVRRRFPKSPFGSIINAGMPSIAASSSNAMQSPVLPLPVMPTQTPWVVRLLES